MMKNTIRKSLWSPPSPHTSTIGLRPTSTIAVDRVAAEQLRARHTSRIVAEARERSTTFSAQNEPATPSGTTANVSSVNSGP